MDKLALKNIAAVQFESNNDQKNMAIIRAGIKTHDRFYETTNLKDFFTLIKKDRDIERIYVHDIGHWGVFLFDWMLNNNFIYAEKVFYNIPGKTFFTLVNNSNSIYYIQINYTKGRIVEVWDINKILHNWPIQRYESYLDISLSYENNCHLLRRECDLLWFGIEFLYQEQMDRMTLGAFTFRRFKEMRYGIGRKKFNELYREEFPVIPEYVEEFIQKAYNGGYVHLNIDHFMKPVEVSVYDINSLYPSVMKGHAYPYGRPLFFEGEPQPTQEYPLFFIRFKCKFVLKDGYLPFVQLNEQGWEKAVDGEYVSQSNGVKEITMTSVDFNLFLEHYKHSPIQYIDGFYFKAKKDVFDEFIDNYNRMKEIYNDNPGKRHLYKIMMNLFYGKFGTKRFSEEKKPIIEDGKIEYETVKEEFKDGEYVPVAAFVTAYARNKLFRAINLFEPEQFVYCDTDSIHFIGDVPQELEVHATQIGKWKKEFKGLAKYHSTKLYILKDHKVVAAGLQDHLQNKINFENFEEGFQVYGSLASMIVPGGVYKYKEWYTITKRVNLIDSKNIKR